ncbi:MULTISPECIES: hypothetical protein [Delftia]|uniref:Uncharacterized protein n=1 Tax=Delftia lacustris TaxID=558537 RepID=A0A1H3MTC5_9BURK|nr:MULTISPECIES: hypothetical protein [Delftia]QPS78362.1 hypothetical protein I6G48_32095 [Delftia acidovorans]QPS84922.1 hypothetical protein I6G47_32770 [Delftia lacustris]SDY79947.1 hypothetical protein SAMN05421547_10836 [Delftia lacustris]
MNKQPIHATLKERFTTEALRGLRFVQNGSRMVKLGVCRRERAAAISRDGQWWRATPLERG